MAMIPWMEEAESFVMPSNSFSTFPPTPSQR